MVKPDPQIFRIAVERLGLDPAEVLMVGDTVEDDGGAAQVGIRTLILPRASGTGHGLGIVLRLVGLAARPLRTPGRAPLRDPNPGRWRWHCLPCHPSRHSRRSLQEEP